MNGRPATQKDLRTAPRWTARLDELLPGAPPAAAAWLDEPGLLTERLRACCDGEPGLTLIAETEAPLAAEDAAVLRASGNAAFVREIELTCDGQPWVFAQTLVPQSTLARQRWLSSLGRAALGLYHRAVRERRDAPGALWARRSWFEIAGDRLLVQEVFLPEAHP
jgi:chorismate--pyruvate lyase